MLWIPVEFYRYLWSVVDSHGALLIAPECFRYVWSVKDSKGVL